MGMFEKIIKENNNRKNVYEEVMIEFKAVINENMEELKQLFSEVHFGYYISVPDIEFDKVRFKANQHEDYGLEVKLINNFSTINLVYSPTLYPKVILSWHINDGSNIKEKIETVIKECIGQILNIKI